MTTSQPDPSRLEISFQLGKQEFCRAHRFHLRRTLLNVKNVIALTMAVGIASLQAQVLGPMGWVGRLFNYVWVVLLGLMVFAFYRLPVQLYRRKPELLERHEVILSREGVHIKTENSEQRLTWELLSRTAENREFFLFYFDATLPTVIPKRAFQGSASGIEEFRRYIGERLFSS